MKDENEEKFDEKLECIVRNYYFLKCIMLLGYIYHL